MSSSPTLHLSVNASHEPPFHHIPFELVSHIFDLCLPHDDLFEFDSYTPWMARGTQAHRLAAVSVFWRNAAFSTPSLWSKLFIDMSQYKRGGEGYELSIKEALQRSRSLPLSFVARVHNVYTDRAGRSLIDLLNSQSHRWDIVHFHLNAKDVRLFSIPQSQQLQAITAHCDQLRTSSHVPVDIHIFKLSGVLPKPSKINIPNFPFANIRIDWSGVTDVILKSDIRDGKLLKLLEAAPRLERCWWQHVGSWLANLLNESSVRRFVHRSLQEFSGSLFEDIGQAITFPSLSQLSVDNNIEASDLQNLLVRSSTTRSLQSLSFRVKDNVLGYIEMLRHVPCLVHLGFVSQEREPRILNHIIATAQQGSEEEGFLPQLESLECKYTVLITPKYPLNWAGIPSLFPSEPDGSGAPDPNSSVTYRPLKSLKIAAPFVDLQRKLNEPKTRKAANAFVARFNVNRLLKIRQQGFFLKIENSTTFNDLIDTIQGLSLGTYASDTVVS